MLECTPDKCANPGPRGGVCSHCLNVRKWTATKANTERRERERLRLNSFRLAQRRADPVKAARESREGARRHRANNPEAHRANKARNGTRWVREWRAAHPEEARLIWREQRTHRYARIRGQHVDYAAILDRDGMTCHLCGAPIPSPSDLHFDHVIPLARGGAHSAENIRPAHSLCNLRKGARLIPC